MKVVMGNSFLSFREKRCCMLHPVCGCKNILAIMAGPLVQWMMFRECKVYW